MKDPLLIIFEGPNYVGKTKTAEAMKTKLEERYKKEVVILREPGGSEFSEELRNILFKHEKLNDYTKSLLFTAARYECYLNDIIPALVEGKIVITDRSLVSTLVYQSNVSETIKMSMPLLELPQYQQSNKLMCILDADTEILNKRREARGVTKHFDTYDTDTLRRRYKDTMFAVETMLIPVWDDCALIKVTDDYDNNNKIISEYLFEQIDKLVEMEELDNE